jgi:hypothetical protein
MMSGAFAEIQEDYARHGVATYPLTAGKTPAVRSYGKVGLDGSRQLALKFFDADAAGFIAGPRNRITVIDIDNPDQRLMAEVQARFGSTPLWVMTPSGGWHGYYKHAGETRRIRPLPDVDILGGGNVVAAGSIVPRGKYQVVRGTLDDLGRLPPMRHQDHQPTGRIPKGRRNTSLFKYCDATVDHCDTLDALLDAATTWAESQFAEPLSAAEIRKTCSSVWNYRGGRKRIMNHILEPDLFRALLANPNANALFTYLSAENGHDAEFWIADGLSKEMDWPRRLVPAARKVLLNLGIVKCIRPHGIRKPALYRWAIRS